MIDAAQLAAKAPPSGVLPPTKESTEAAFLDLRADRVAVASSKARAVAAAFGPSLYLQASLRLVIASGELSPSTVAGWFAAASPQSDGGQIAVVRGEDVIDRLEEITLAGCDLGDMNPPPVAAWAPVTASVLSEAVSTGATVVISRFASPERISDAINAESVGELATQPTSIRLNLAYVDSYACVLEAATREILASALEAVPEVVSAQCESRLHLIESKDSSLLSARLEVASNDFGALREFVQRVELALPAGTLRVPAAESISARYRQRTTDGVPFELLEYGVDVRPTKEWQE
ncbi:MAG: hypothetical protein AAF266_13855 [Planctomycetota bacterium]